MLYNLIFKAVPSLVFNGVLNEAENLSADGKFIEYKKAVPFSKSTPQPAKLLEKDKSVIN